MLQALRIVALLCVPLLTISCSGTEGHGSGEHDGGGRGEHAREHDGERGGEHGGGEGEESGTELALTATYDKVRNGARLILTYEAATNSFVGTVENTTDKALEAVRVEVHLSNGRELGPTPRADLAPGEKRPVRLKAESTGFERWNAHPEIGSGEHGGEGEGEHGREERGGEHGGERRGEHR